MVVVQDGADPYTLVGAGQRHEEAFLFRGEHRCELRVLTAGRCDDVFGKPAMQHDVGKLLAAEQGVAWGEVGPLALLYGRHEHQFPMPSGRARRRGQCHGLVDRRGVGEGIGFDGERTDLFDERADGARGHHAFGLAAGRVAEQAHRRVETVIGGTAFRVVAQRHPLPHRGFAERPPDAIEHVLRFARRQTRLRRHGVVQHLPQVLEGDGLRVLPPQYRGDRVEHAGRVPFQQQDVERVHAEGRAVRAAVLPVARATVRDQTVIGHDRRYGRSGA